MTITKSIVSIFKQRQKDCVESVSQLLKVKGIKMERPSEVWSTLTTKLTVVVC